MTLLEAMLRAPLVGVDDREDDVAHRVNADGLPIHEWATADHVTAVCGHHVRLLPMSWPDLRVRGTNWMRCRPCREWRPS